MFNKSMTVKMAVIIVFIFLLWGCSRTKIEEPEEVTESAEENADDPCTDKVAMELLKIKGIEDCRVILEDLESHPELIPYDGVLGGTMRWSGPRILNSKWVYSEFSDGHIVGYSVLEYEIRDDLTVEWTIVDAFLDGE